MEFLTLASNRHRNVLATLLDLQPLWGVDARLNFISAGIPALAILQRREPVAVKCRIRIGRVRIQTLPDEQTRFAMSIAAASGERNVRGQREVAGDSFPNEVEGIVGEPHIFPATRDAVSAPSW